MRIPERPRSVKDLSLMQRLLAYSRGQASWYETESLDPHEESACTLLHATLSDFVEKSLQPLLNRATAQEMRTFTSHDSNHGLKVAHLMWFLLSPRRRERLTPAEIALLILTAFLHDIGMGLNDAERAARLSPTSDLWDSVDPHSDYRRNLEELERMAQTGKISDVSTQDVIAKLFQSQEAILCLDLRERHATRSRYDEIIAYLSDIHVKDRSDLVDPYLAFSFDGDSLMEKAIDICISHNQNAISLNDCSASDSTQARFPVEYAVGCCICDTKMVAAALRLADIIDFDRERTPKVLFHYLLPMDAKPDTNRSVREWSKHLAISNWEIKNEALVYRGRSPSAIIHHSVVQFCSEIQIEIERTQVALGDDWPFTIQASVIPKIQSNGYRYLPYTFSIDEDRIYNLLMGRRLYENRFDGLRELIQNAVDACKLRDAILLSDDKTLSPTRENRISVKLWGAENNYKLSISDTGAGMDRYIIETFFLKVGSSYYKSTDFVKTLAKLRRAGSSFKPVAEFGIGFISSFMLGNPIEVETAPFSPMRDDNQRRLLKIDGIGKLIEVTEKANSGSPRFSGTDIRIDVKLKSGESAAQYWRSLKEYVRLNCVNLFYSMNMECSINDLVEKTSIQPRGLKIDVMNHLREAVFRVGFDPSQDDGLSGEILIYKYLEKKKAERELASTQPIRFQTDNQRRYFRKEAGNLLRGGFRIGSIPGMPSFGYDEECSEGRLEIQDARFASPDLIVTDLSRSRLAEASWLENYVERKWLRALMARIDEVELNPIGPLQIGHNGISQSEWMQEFSALSWYRLAKSCFLNSKYSSQFDREMIAGWEAGTSGLFLSAGSGSLCDFLFKLTLPRVCGVKLHPFKEELMPPKANWRKILSEDQTFIDDKLNFGWFCPYADTIQKYSYYLYCSGFNEKFKEQFDDIHESEYRTVQRSLIELVRSQEDGRPAMLTEEDHKLILRLAKYHGAMLLGDGKNTYKLAKIIGNSGR